MKLFLLLYFECKWNLMSHENKKNVSKYMSNRAQYYKKLIRDQT